MRKNSLYCDFLGPTAASDPPKVHFTSNGDCYPTVWIIVVLLDYNRDTFEDVRWSMVDVELKV